MIIHTPTVEYFENTMMAWSPPDQQKWREKDIEGKEEGEKRYAEIATGLYKVVFDPNFKAIQDFPSKYRRSMTAMVALGIANEESHFARSVYYNLPAWKGFGDHGNSFCLMQLQLPRNRSGFPISRRKTYFGGWTSDEVVQDVEKCFAAGIAIIKSSMGSCHSFDFYDRLSQYATGHCEADNEKSRIRLHRGVDWFWTHLPPFTDEEVLAATAEPEEGKMGMLDK